MLKTNTITDTHKVLSRIKTNKEYQSFQQIIEESIKENFPSKKKIYKIKKSKTNSNLSPE